MEISEFDAMTKSVSGWRTRRSLVKAAGAAALAAVLGTSQATDDTNAKRRRVRGEHNIRGNKAIMCINGETRRVRKKKRNKYLKRGASRGKCPSGCTPDCAPGYCGDDGCGGTCACGSDTICVSGTCEACDVACPSGDAAICGEGLLTAIAAGGTILVCPGEYEGRFPLTVSVEIIGSGSGDDPAVDTILLGADGLGSVVPVTSAVTARLASMRITGGNGVASNSGGVYVNNASADVTLDACTLIENTGNYGGGASVYSGELTITGSDISFNTATNGGAIATASTSTIESTTITNNTASSSGGGVFVNSGTSTLGSGVTITDNTSNGGANTGGGIYKFTAGATINNSATVTNNNPDNCAGNGFTC